MSDFLGFEISATIAEDDYGTILFKYPKLFRGESILEEIRLEIGALAKWNPYNRATIKSYVYDIYPQLYDDGFVNVNVTTLERSFWEKATILHQEANRPETSIVPYRYSRHYYDVYCIAKSGIINNYREQGKLLEEVANFKNKFYPRNWAKYDLARIGTIRLVRAGSHLSQLEDDYKKMKDMIYGERPSFNELIDYIAILEKMINSN